MRIEENSCEQEVGLYSVICKPGDIVCALKKLIRILDKENLRLRKVPEELVDEAQSLRLFLGLLLNIIQEKSPNDYADLLRLLDKVDADKRFLGYLPFKGCLLDSLSILSLKSRQKAIINCLNESIERTGGMKDSLFSKIKISYYNELLESVALFYALKGIGNKLGLNPLKGIRANIGNRSVEEYFSDLIAGWIYEDWVIANIEFNLPKSCRLVMGGTDAYRKIKFSEIGGEPDFEIRCSNKVVRFEVQRVGKNSCKKKLGFDLRQNLGKSIPTLMWIELKTHKVNNNDFILFVFPSAFELYEPFKGKLLVVPVKKLKEIRTENELEKCWYYIDEAKAPQLIEEMERKLEETDSLSKRTKNAFKRRLESLKNCKSEEEKLKCLKEVLNFVRGRASLRSIVKSELSNLIRVREDKFFLLRDKNYSKVGINLQLIKDEDLVVKFDSRSISKLLGK